MDEAEYISMVKETAKILWGEANAEKMMQHIETTAAAVWRNSQTNISPMREPTTRLRYREKS